MAVILGTGAYRYEVSDNWAKLPPGREFNADVAAVGVDAQDRVYAFNRGAHPMCVFDRDGNFLRSWGEGVFRRAHGVHMAPDDTLWLTDDGDHTVRHCTLDGKVLLTLGVPGVPKPYMSGEPFHRCTHTALSPQGDLYVSDGYGNSRVHKYSPDGQLLLLLGRAGHRSRPVQHRRTTSAATRKAGYTWPTARTIACRCSTATAGTRRSGTTCIAPPACFSSARSGPLLRGRDRRRHGRQQRHAQHRAAREHLQRQGSSCSRGSGNRPAGLELGQFISPHGLAVDSRGDIYVGEVSFTNWGSPRADPGHGCAACRSS